MALKRKAQEAFEKPPGHISAFAAAKLARQSGTSSPTRSSEVYAAPDGNDLAVEAAITPYDGHHSGAVTPNAGSIEDNEPVSSPTRFSKAPLSTFALTESSIIYEDDSALEIVLKRDEIVTIIGEYALEVIHPNETIVVAGAVLTGHDGMHRIYATTVHAIPQIRSLSDSAMIRISSVTSGLSKLEKLSPLFKNIWNSKAHGHRSFDLVGAFEEDALRRPLNALEIDQHMDRILGTVSRKAADSVQKPPRIMVIGAKSSGKSTLNRLLCNYFFSWTDKRRLSYLDLDPGQPEFGPPGQISLVEVATPILGPPFTHPASSHSKDFKLIRSHTIAATHFKDDPEHYIACARDLIKHTNTSRPIVVNSCGWVSGVGADVLVDLVSMLNITDVVLLEPLDESFITSLKNKSPDMEFYRIPRRAVKPLSRPPAETRAMQTMSYFHHRPSTTISASRWSGKSINKIRPWIASYAGNSPGVAAVMSYGPSPSPQYLSEVLDGSVVAITTLDADIALPFLEDVSDQPTQSATHQLEDFIERTPEDIPYIPPNEEDMNRKLNPQTSQCIGLALIRGIDTKRKEFHLATPLSDSQIAGLAGKQVVLVRGSFDSPEWAYLEGIAKDDDRDGAIERPWVSEKGMAGIEGSVWRLRHPPVASAMASAR